MRALDLHAMHAPEFSEYVNVASDYTADSQLCMGMQFKDREAIV